MRRRIVDTYTGAPEHGEPDAPLTIAYVLSRALVPIPCASRAQNGECTVSTFRTILFPLPADLSLVKVAQKENSKPAAIVARLRSMTTAMTVQDGDETATTTAKGNSGHNVPLNAAQYAEAERIIEGLRAGSAEKASAEAKATAAAIVAELREHGGIRLPVNRQGRHAATGESIGDLFAGLTPEA